MNKYIRFVATECGGNGDDELMAGASNSKGKDDPHTFIFMGKKSKTGDSAYFELDGQGWGGDGLVSTVVFCKDILKVTLKRTQKTIPFTGIEVNFGQCNAKDRDIFIKNLKSILGKRIARC